MYKLYKVIYTLLVTTWYLILTWYRLHQVN